MRTRRQAQIKVTQLLSTLLIMYVFTGILLLILAFLLVQFQISEQIAAFGILAVYLLSGLLGGSLIGKKCRQNRILWGCGIGFLYFLLLFIGALALKTQGNGLHLQTIFTGICSMGAGMLGAFLQK